ncbi:MAPK/MAK/MRK overlapping kinase-like [Corticium candelabrum]|uniref:MAPK/MAK/MRK overlapping kinase-like n=1 Tax=Corticium candelabrum TaxID=121492 RepID=UPI002E2524C1|nr:MAPK/MAK/MRK overlapping kinase-like [Corticium candelabrum]
MQNYRIIGKKGEGTFSTVLKCQNIKDGSYYACKRMKQSFKSQAEVNNLREIQAMRKLMPHPNIVQLIETIYDRRTGTLALVCELLDCNIYDFIRGRKHYLPETQVKRLIYQLCKALEFMHRKGIFHRDVKPENILLKGEVVKLADFGSCRSIYSKPPYTEYISTRWYRAPECLLTDGYYSYKMDVWSVGCVLFEVLSLHPFFPGTNELDQIARIHDTFGTPSPDLLSKFKKSRALDFNFPRRIGTGISQRLAPCKTSKDGIKYINECCIYDPDERMSAKQALRHSYFKDLWDLEHNAAAAAAADEHTGDKFGVLSRGTPAEPSAKTQQYRKAFKRRRKPRLREDAEFLPTAVPTIHQSRHSHLPTLVPASSMMLPQIVKAKQSKPQHRNPHDSMFGYPSQFPAIHKRGAGGGGLS